MFFKTEICRGNVKVEFDLSTCATKADLKSATGVDASYFAKKTDLAHLTCDVDKIDIDQLKHIPINECFFLVSAY